MKKKSQEPPWQAFPQLGTFWLSNCQFIVRNTGIIRKYFNYLQNDHQIEYTKYR